MAARNTPTLKPLRVLGVIPARLASTRLPEKPLKQIAGMTLVERVWRQAKQARSIQEIVVATDAEKIEQAVRRFGGNALMTSPALTTGSERVRAAAVQLGGTAAWDIVVNIQGDMPFLPPAVIDDAIGFFGERRDHFDLVTIAAPIEDEQLFLQNSVVKVAVGENSRALYFSRAPIPCSRDGARMRNPFNPSVTCYGLKHFGLYLFTPKTLEAYVNDQQSDLERIEMLEQLRLLERGYRIGVLIVDPQRLANSIEIDTPADLDRAEQLARA